MMRRWLSSRHAMSAHAAAMMAVALTSSPAATQRFEIKPVVEKKIRQLPSGPLFWHIVNFPTIAQAQAAAGPTGLAAEVAGKVWLFTLGMKNEPAPAGGTSVADIGPVPPISAPEYLLRIVSSGGPPGAKTPVHTHPGSETFYVLTGELSQRSLDGVRHVEAGQSMPGHGPGMPMEVSSSGSGDLQALVMFVMDATKPFSSPAKLPELADAAPPPTQQIEAVKTLTARDMVGSWSLESDVSTTPDGHELLPFGPTPRGLAIFNPDGRFAIVLSRPDLPRFASDNRMKGTAAENEAIVRGSFAFFGTYSVADGVIVQHIEGGTWPEWVGTDQKRTITSFAKDEQTWTTVPSFGGKSELRWSRAN